MNPQPRVHHSTSGRSGPKIYFPKKRSRDFKRTLEGYLASKIAAGKKQGESGTINPSSKELISRRFEALINANPPALQGLLHPNYIMPYLLEFKEVNSAVNRCKILREFEK